MPRCPLSLALYLAIRGITLLVRCGNLPDAHPLKVGRAGWVWTCREYSMACLVCAKRWHGRLVGSGMLNDWLTIADLLPPASAAQAAGTYALGARRCCTHVPGHQPTRLLVDCAAAGGVPTTDVC